MQASRVPDRLWLAAFLLAIAGSAFWLFYPAGVSSDSAESSLTADGQATRRTTAASRSVLEAQGNGVLVVGAIPPVVLALVWAPWVRHRRRARATAAIALTGIVLVSLASVGIMYAPSMVVAWVSFALTPVAT